MATTSYGVNDSLAVKLWAKKLFQESLKETYFARFMGSSSNSLLQIKDETNKGAGDQITIGLRMQLNGDGVAGDGTLEGNEEALTTYSMPIVIDQLRHAVRSSGKMSEQRVPFSVRDEAKTGLKDWWSGRLDTWFFNQLCGNTAVTDTRFTGMQAPVAPSTGAQIWVSGSDDQSLTSAHVFTILQIDRCIERAKTATPMIRPIRVGGEDKYVMFLHPFQVYDLRTTATAGQVTWFDINRSALAGGRIGDNPIYTGALGEYNGVVLHEATRVTAGVNSSTAAAVANVRRAVFCGAQAAVMAYGKDSSGGEMSWTEELFDYGNQLGVSAGMIGGLRKSRFNNLDFGTIVVSSWAAAH